MHVLSQERGYNCAEAEIVVNERGSKGFGFVTLGSAGEAARAKTELHGYIVDGRPLIVRACACDICVI